MPSGIPHEECESLSCPGTTRTSPEMLMGMAPWCISGGVLAFDWSIWHSKHLLYLILIAQGCHSMIVQFAGKCYSLWVINSTYCHSSFEAAAERSLRTLDDEVQVTICPSLARICKRDLYCWNLTFYLLSYLVSAMYSISTSVTLCGLITSLSEGSSLLATFVPDSTFLVTKVICGEVHHHYVGCQLEPVLWRSYTK